MARVDPNKLARLLFCLWVGTLVALLYHTRYTGPDTWLHYGTEGSIVVVTGLALFAVVEKARRLLG